MNQDEKQIIESNPGRPVIKELSPQVELKRCDDIDADTVTIVPIIVTDTGDKQLVLIKHNRPPLKKPLIEFPGGFIEEGETAIEAAIRELKEETGLVPARIRGRGPTVVRSVWKKIQTTVVVYVEIFQEPPSQWKSPEGNDIEVYAVDLDGIVETIENSDLPMTSDVFHVLTDFVNKNSIG